MGKVLEVGEQAPDFCLPDQNSQPVCLKDFKGKWLILYFYPRDNTPGCTIEAVDFTCIHQDFREMGAMILGVSPDSAKSHLRFIDKKELRLTLLSDPEHQVLETYGAWQLKKMYGRESYGVVRSTFLIDPIGKIAFIWPKVKAKGHADAVKKKLSELQP